MLGSYFDLKREVARIAARRAAADADRPRSHREAAYSDFDDRLNTFVRSFRGDGYGDEKSALRSSASQQSFRSRLPASGGGAETF